jgi:hypothetical protein
MKTKSLILLLPLFGFAWCPVYCAEPSSPSLNPKIILQINAGAPNPSFEASPADYIRLMEMVNKLPDNIAVTAGNKMPAIVGYAGFKMGPFPMPATSEMLIIRVYRHDVEISSFGFGPNQGNDSVDYRTDVNRALETELAKLADAHHVLDPRSAALIASGEDVRNRKKK